MKFYNFLLNKSNTTETLMRSVVFDVIESADDQITKQISEDSRSTDMLNLLNELNALLKREYKGKKYRFDFCLESNNGLDKIKLTDIQKQKIKKRWLEYSQKLSNIQYEIEEKMGS